MPLYQSPEGDRSGSRPPRRRQRHGNVLIFVLIAVALLAGFVALAADYGMVRMVKSELQGAVDAATRAACTGLAVGPDEARARAKAVAVQNIVNGQPLTLTDADIELGKWVGNGKNFVKASASNEAGAEAVQITGRLDSSRGTDVKLTWLPLLGGAKSTSMSASSVSTQTSAAQDLVLVQDVSLSFYYEIGLARAGDLNLLDAMKKIGGTSSFGVVAFTGTATTPSVMRNITGNYNALKTAVESLNIQTAGMPSVVSGTDIAAGMEQGLSLFATYGQASPNRAMVIVSDGEPTQQPTGAHPTLTAAQLLTLAQQRADQAWAQGISVFVVFWDNENNAVSAANLKTLARGRGTFVHVTDPAKLSDSIANVLTRTTTVK